MDEGELEGVFKGGMRGYDEYEVLLMKCGGEGKENGLKVGCLYKGGRGVICLGKGLEGGS